MQMPEVEKTFLNLSVDDKTFFGRLNCTPGFNASSRARELVTRGGGDEKLVATEHAAETRPNPRSEVMIGYGAAQNVAYKPSTTESTYRAPPVKGPLREPRIAYSSVRVTRYFPVSCNHALNTAPVDEKKEEVQATKRSTQSSLEHHERTRAIDSVSLRDIVGVNFSHENHLQHEWHSATDAPAGTSPSMTMLSQPDRNRVSVSHTVLPPYAISSIPEAAEAPQDSVMLLTTNIKSPRLLVARSPASQVSGKSHRSKRSGRSARSVKSSLSAPHSELTPNSFDVASERSWSPRRRDVSGECSIATMASYGTPRLAAASGNFADAKKPSKKDEGLSRRSSRSTVCSF